MRLTARDIRVLRDLSLSHVLSRDQFLDLGYFDSVTRVNTRLRGLKNLGLLRVLDTPFYNQHLYSVTATASDVVGERLQPLTAARTGSPRFLQHALATTNIRISLKKKGATGWRFEQQLWHTFTFRGKEWQIRPDGMALRPNHQILVETDLGHVAPAKFKEKLLGYSAFLDSGECAKAWKLSDFSLLVVTTGTLRATRLKAVVPSICPYEVVIKPHADLKIPFPGSWS